MSDALVTSSPLQLRAELEAMVLNDLLGPAGGPTEIITERNVRGRYVLGLLAPKGQTALPDDDDELTQSGTDTEDGKAEAAPLKSATMLPSSIGLTFTVGKETAAAGGALRLTARWGHYDHVRRTDGDEDRSVWQRTPVEGFSEPIPLKPGRIKAWSPSPDYPDVVVQGLMRERDHQWSVTLFLINGQVEPAHNKDSAWLFQPELIVESADGEAIFRKRAQWRDPARADLEDQAMQMLYRRQVEFAVGHGVAVHADLVPDCWDCAVRLSTRLAPVYEVPKTTPPTSDEIPAFKSLVLDMQTLSQLRDDEFAIALDPLVTAYAAWIDEQAARLAHPTKQSPSSGGTDDLIPFDHPAREAIEQCQITLRRLRDGIDLLGRKPQAAQAFRFANRAMWQQRVHSIYAREIRQGKTITLDEVDTPTNRTWYPFQLAFVLINLPGLTDPLHPDRADSHDAIADVLWFPTGGGKTEAYLGLTAYTLGIRRLQGDVAGYSGRGGVAVLMRYTLRLLTLQQFQRAAALICACELIRREDPATWGDEPFRIGLWVGQRSTPNRTEDAAEILKQDHGFAPHAGRARHAAIN